jgi:acyl-CoA synthetase (AMP-forming)/AMP-acid ligase II
VLPPHTVGHLFLAGVPTLAAGGILSLAPFVPREFGRLVEATGASIAIVLPVMFRMLETHGIESLRPLRTLGTGASTVPVTMPARALRMGIERFVHMFGMTEALTPVFAHETTDAEAPDATALRGPLGDTDARFARDGELLLRGSAITRGYHADPHATAAAFDEDGFFRTGDLFDRSSDLLHFRGRRDELVKINDMSVSPTLTEAVVGSVPGVAACAVGAVRRRSGADRLVALVKGTETSAAEIRAACRSGVDAHQVPAQVVFVDDVPLNAMGKVDRQRAAELFRGLATA